ncbi:alpha/beta hydrolase [Zhengella mangrovi]|uniref:Alpha/beta hydrolase n=1 Tax=Zhengella mangrovi TaxID=1982044 RepID=A0A2G1QM60_9HYPH|nr:alpha/beta hydrolase [Zhengella mangrovi]PHP66616.1 alpha/beta hydrolase [Zhengella mangrovi]
MSIRFSQADLPAGRFHFAEAGEAGRPLLLCLHGFPESWLAYEAVMPLLAERFHVVAPDQRGFNRSPKPEGVEAYQARYLVADMFALADRLSPEQPITLTGHDWGSAVAYAMAFTRPERIARLIVANGVHPWCFQNAIVNDAGQRAASQYMTRLRAPDAAGLLAANDFEKLMNMMAGFSATGWLTPALQAAYNAQWREPGALEAMLNWYRGSPIVVPGLEETAVAAPLLAAPEDAMRVRMPHLVLWGQEDIALTPACLGGLERFAADLSIRPVDGASHWILHEQPQRVAAEILAFAAS